MRPTLIVLGVVVALGAVAYVKLRSTSDATPPLAGSTGAKAAGAKAAGEGPAAAGAADAPRPAMGGAGEDSRDPSLAARLAPGDSGSGPEADAKALRMKLAERLAANDATAASALEERLAREFGETLEFRRLALERGIADSRLALDDRKSLEVRTEAGLRARRSLSSALFLPELFDAVTGRPNASRAKLIETIAAIQTFVMTRSGGIKDVTRPYDVISGDNPLRIVSRDRLPYGPNVLLFWNRGGSLDPRRLKVGDRLLVPLETLSVRVNLERHTLGLYLGEALVREFTVGVGKAATPTPPGTYEVKDKYLNPDWHSPTGVIPYGDARNELGDAWIEISSPEKPKGYGIHGTIKPETVGADGSNGCVRLRNEEAVEMTSWVRTSRGDGQATKVIIR